MPRVPLTALAIVSLSLFTTGACSTDEISTDSDFRSLDVNVTLTMADGGSDDGTILWEIGEGDVYKGLRSNSDLLFYIEDDVIYTASGEATCTIEAPYLNSNIREVSSTASDDVLFTIWDDFVFEGHIDLDKPQKWAQLKDEALFEYRGDEIFLGRWTDGFRLVEADTALDAQSDGRKLLMAALLTGECGSQGLPGYSF